MPATRRPRTAPLAACLLLGLLAAVACDGASAPSTTLPPPSGASAGPSLTPAAIPQEAIDAAVAFRELVGLRADEGWVREVAGNPSQVTAFGHPLLPDEATQLEGRPRDFDTVAGIVQQYGSDHAGEFGGVFVEPPGSTRLVVTFTGHVDQHVAALAKLLHPAAALEVRQVQVAQGDLDALMEQIANDEGLKAAGIFPVTIARREQAGTVHVEVSTELPDAAALMAARYGPRVTTAILDPTGAYLKPRGTILGRVVDAEGDPIVAGLDPRPLFAEIPMDAVGRGTAPDGTFRFDGELAGRWRIDARTEDGRAGQVEVDLPPGGTVEVEIVVLPAG